MIPPGISDTYTATASYQQPPNVITIPLNDVAGTTSPDPESLPEVDAGLDEYSREESHYYSEIGGDERPSSLMRLPPAPAASASPAVTSSCHVTETDTPIKRVSLNADSASAVYSGLDVATMTERPTFPSVYEALNGAEARPDF